MVERLRFLDAQGREVPAGECVRLERYVYGDDGELLRVEYFEAVAARNDRV